MKVFLLLLMYLFLMPVRTSAQVPVTPNVIFAKEFSKDIALYKAKEFVFTNVLGMSAEVVHFEIDPLAATGSGELTSLVYRCNSKNMEGMVLGFYGDYWNEAGVSYKGFSFKDLPKSKAIPLLEKLQKAIDDNSKYLNQDKDNNNIYFEAEGMTFLIFNSGNGIKLRVFWNQFDSEWDMIAFKRTKRRLLNKLNDD